MRFMKALLASILLVSGFAHADSIASGPLYGRDNLAAWYASEVLARTNGTTFNVHIVGDSRVCVYVDAAFRLDQLLIAASQGYPVQVTYECFGGQNSYIWANGEAADFVSQHPETDLLIVDFGINEKVTGATGGPQTDAQTEANFRAADATIRASRSLSSLSILYLAPTPANNDNPIYNQTTAVAQVVGDILKVVANDTHAGYFATLELYQRAHSEAGWMEQLGAGYGGGNVHPGNPENLSLMGEISHGLFPIPYAPVVGADGIANPTPANGWTHWAAGYDPRVVLHENIAIMNGLIKPGTTTALTTLFTLPVGYRPSVNRFYNVSASNAGCNVEVQVLSSGIVRNTAAFTCTYISLDNIMFNVQ